MVGNDYDEPAGVAKNVVAASHRTQMETEASATLASSREGTSLSFVKG